TRPRGRVGGQPCREPSDAQDFIAAHTRTEQDRLHPPEDPKGRRRQPRSNGDLPLRQRGACQPATGRGPQVRLDLAWRGLRQIVRSSGLDLYQRGTIRPLPQTTWDHWEDYCEVIAELLRSLALAPDRAAA